MKTRSLLSVLIMIFALVAIPLQAKEAGGAMKPIAPLMIEHRLIERMVTVMEEAVAGKKINPVFVDMVLDFFIIYGDRTHHGKEEDILFSALAKKNLSPEHRKMLDTLLDEHVQARKKIAKLAEAREKYVKGDVDAATDILTTMNDLTVLYRKHIELEDKHFFIPSLGYFTNGEMDAMLGEMWEYDRNVIHVKYRDVVQKAGELAKR
jgi:hemerythrin-like domain-containing protein